MSRAIHTRADYLYLPIHGIEEELDAIWGIAVETYPAEPYSHGGSRGMEIEARARLISWHRHSVEYSRADAVEIAGEIEIQRQEEATAESLDDGAFAAAMYGDQFAIAAE